MKNNNPLPLHSMVTVWLTTIGQQKPTQPEMMSDEVRDFNMKLINEEVTELLTAMKNNDFTETCDGYFDALWVITQAAMLNGININELLFAGFNSNMSKFCKTVEEVEDTIVAYATGKHPSKMGVQIATHYEQVGDLYIIRRNSDNKVMKSINFKEPDFSAITSRLTVNEEV
jgi:NTP pyrophosphatase (non-canonical NTP hydrolase)